MIETYRIDDDKVVFVMAVRGHVPQFRRGESARAAPLHLFEHGATLHRPHEEDNFQRLDVCAGGDHIHGNGNARVEGSAELAKQIFGLEALEPCTVLCASTENAGSAVVRPRFAQLEGDAARLVLLRGVVSGGYGQSTPPSLRDTPALEDALQRTHARLLIVDPLHSCFGVGVDLHHSGETRPVLAGLARLAESHRCCILFVRHLSKRGTGRAIHRGSSSREPSAPSSWPLVRPMHRRIPPCCRSNRIWAASPRLWDTALTRRGASPGPASASSPPRKCWAGQPKRKFVPEWLRQRLLNGTRSQYSIEAAAQRDGVPIATLRRSKFDLGVKSSKDGKSGARYWTLPPTEEDPAT
jgi:hypothetical protein